MAWGQSLAIEVVEVFATAQAPHTTAVADRTLSWSSALLAQHREHSRESMRRQRGGLKGYAYNDGRWRGRRPATKYVQLELPLELTMREKLPDDRVGVTQKFTILHAVDGVVKETDIYLIVNPYPDRNQLGEIFLHIGKAGHTEAIYDEWAKTTSRSLQHGVPVDELFWPHVNTRFDPQGATTNKDFPRCTSILDLVSRWVLARYGNDVSKKRIAKMRERPEEVQP